ncbi:heavy-metal-associated domain-containing protein [Deinococcus multiflagellatus]|uniref:Heavy-metal-associated domain-containing protein n=1 Tax=Deinococcus multiflagellatus TaxID=1656887 RepID=A0ABW1ZPB2_9DEIO|nr:heavy-metal-associated domain-containing protein [Deinococcus multiflagellatus]MBZ9715687.1 cation transporter [Deinococcus multiflagellatus]
MTRIEFTVRDMSCTACVMTLEGLEDDVRGVLQVKADYRRQRLTVEYDDAQVTAEEIAAAVRALGYEPQPWRGRDPH